MNNVIKKTKEKQKHSLFEHILIPISSEFYQKEIFEISTVLAEKFHSTITLLYIIEEKTLDQTDKLSDVYRTTFEKEVTKKEIIQRYISSADNIIFKDAKQLFTRKNILFNETIIQGEFSEVIKGQVAKNDYDLIIMGFEKECVLNYRLFDDIDIPIWIESGHNKESLLAVCSNLAPNQKVPEISIHLSQILGLPLHMLYVVDIEDTVEVDSIGHRSERKSLQDLTKRARSFASSMQERGVQVTIVNGILEKETEKAAKQYEARLVIVGREQKKRGIFGLKSLKRKMAEKCEYSILFVN